MAINNLSALGYGSDLTRMMPQGIDQQYQDVIGGYNANLADQRARSDQISGGYEKMYARTMDNIGGLGDAQRLQLEDQYRQQLGQAQGSAASRGMWNTSAYGGLTRQAGDSYIKNRIGLEDTLTRQRVDYDTGITGQLLNYQAQANRDQYGMAQNVMGAQQHRADQGLGFYGQQQGLEQQNANRMMQADQFNAQYGQQNQQFAQNLDFQKAKWYGYADGGTIPGYGRGDTVPIMAEPGEFMLSRDMIAGLEDGSLDTFKLRDIIRRDRMKIGQPVQEYGRGGTILSEHDILRMKSGMESKRAKMQTTMLPAPSAGTEAYSGGSYRLRGAYG